MDLMIYLMLKRKENEINLKEPVFILYSHGLPIQDIADILGKPRNSIDKQLTALRKEGKVDSNKTKEALPIEKNPTERKNEQ
jgi:predicted ArsR family transcriptional regulator